MADPTFYAATLRFRSAPAREAVILLEAVHPVIFALAYPHALGDEQSPVLLHWAEIPLDQAPGLWEAYGAAGRSDDIVSLDGLREQLIGMEAQFEKHSLVPHLKDAQSKLLAVQAYADGIGHVFEDTAAPAS